MIDAETETLLSLSDAAKTLPGRPNISTLHRWRKLGVCNVKLEVLCVGGRTYTSREALARFAERVTAAKAGEAAPPRSTGQRRRAHAAAVNQLAEDGI